MSVQPDAETMPRPHTARSGRRFASRLRQPLFYAYVLLASMALLLPVSRWLRSATLAELDREWNLDKTIHVALFAGLTYLACWSQFRWPGVRRAIGILVVAVVFGAGIEVVQSLTGYRTGDLRDLVADVVGAIVGVVAAWAILGPSDGRKPDSGQMTTPADTAI